MSNTETKLTRKEQWTANAIKRRERIKQAGGRILNVLVDGNDNAMLEAVIEHRAANDPGFNLTKWVAKMIAADYNQIKRRSRATPKSARSAVRSN